MTRGARPGLKQLRREFGERVVFVSVHVREAHPGERYPHHTSDAQKMRHAKDWARLDRISWTIAVDTIDGAMHRAYGTLPNSLYIVNSAGVVAFRALWAGQPGLLRDKLEELLRLEEIHRTSVTLGERENLVIPLIHGAAEFDPAVVRGGTKSVEDFRREMGTVMYGVEKLMSRMRPLIHRRAEAA
jgi:hypothetical protein